MGKEKKNSSSPNGQKRKSSRITLPLVKGHRRAAQGPKVSHMLTKEEKQVREQQEVEQAEVPIVEAPIPRAFKKPRITYREHFNAQKPDMLKLLGIKSKAKPIKLEPPGEKNNYRCNFCRKLSSYKIECELHQSNMHFLEHQESYKYVVRQEPLFLMEQENEEKHQYHLLYFRLKDETLKYYRCNHCQYANLYERYVKEHLEKYCLYNLSALGQRISNGIEEEALPQNVKKQELD